MGDALRGRGSRTSVRPFTRALSVAALLIAVTGCGLVPTGGPVLNGRPVQPPDPMVDPYVGVIPTGPQPGWTPEQIVRGFLSDSASFQNDHAAARKYLVEEVRGQWEPSDEVTVYAEDPGFRVTVEQSTEHDAKVTVVADQVGTIDARGQYTAADPDARLTARFRLHSVGGEWRIVSFPQGLLLTDRDVARAYRTLNLYFFEPKHEVLVPNPVYVPAGNRSGLPTRLVRALLRGATSWLDSAVDNAFPAGTYLTEAVSVVGGEATVKLGGTASVADDRTLASMSAQLAWTLEQLPEVERIRLKVDGEAVTMGGGETISTEDWAALDPAGTSGTVHGYVVRDSKLLVTSQNGLEPAPGPAGSGDVSVHTPAVSLDAKQAAWLSESATKLFVGELREGGDYREAMSGEKLRPPSWDRHGNLWVVDDGGEGSAVWMLHDGEAVDVDAPELEDKDVRALHVARDGTRVAAVVGGEDDSHVVLGRIERADDETRIDGLTRLPTDLAEVVDLAWRDADRLAVLGKDPQGVFAPYLVAVDGGGISATGSAGTMVSIAAAPDVPMLTELAAGKIYQSQDDLGWRPLGRGVDPAYPG